MTFNGNSEARTRLNDRRIELGSYGALAQELGINVYYVYSFIKKGKIPANKKACQAMGIGLKPRHQFGWLMSFYETKEWKKALENRTEV